MGIAYGIVQKNLLNANLENSYDAMQTIAVANRTFDQQLIAYTYNRDLTFYNWTIGISSAALALGALGCCLVPLVAFLTKKS